MQLNLIILLFLFFTQEVDVLSDEIITNSSQRITCRILKIDGRLITYATLYRGQFKSFTVLADTVKEIHHNRENITSLIKRDSVVTYYTLKTKDPAISKTIDSSLVAENLDETSTNQSSEVPSEEFEIPLYLWITGGVLLLIPLLYLIISLLV